MAVENTNTTSEITKRVYGEELERIPFEVGILGEFIPFKAEKKIGDTYRTPVALTFEHGVTYNGTAGSVVTLTDAISATVKQADVAAYEFIERSKLAYRLMMDAVGAGEAAYEAATSMVLSNLQESAEFRREHSMLYGQEGLGKVSAVTAGSSLLVITITDATWSAGTWDNMEGAVLGSWTSQSASATQHDGDLTISAVDLVNKTVTVTAAADAYTNVAVNDWLYFKGARTASGFNEMVGLHKILANTGSLFGLDAGAYSRWRANQKNSMGQPNFEKFLQGISKLAGRRLRRTKLMLFQAPSTYEVINSDLTSARRFDGSYSRSKGSAGFETLEYYGQTGLTSIMVHPMLRDGDAMALTEKNAVRIGSTDLTFEFGPAGKGDIWFHLQDKNAMEARVLGIQQVFLKRPAHSILFDGITIS